MFNFFKKQSKKSSNTDDKKAIETVMDKSGWTRRYTVAQMEDARKRLGISYKDYDRRNFYNIPIEKQEEEYQKILKRRLQRKKEKEKCISSVMIKAGWTRENTETQMEDARKRLGISYREYDRRNFHEIPINQQEEEYQKILVAKEKRIKKEEERKKKQNEKYISSVMAKAGWTRENTETQMEDARKRLGISYRDYDRRNFHEIPIERQQDKYKKILAVREQRKKEKEKCISSVMARTGWSYDDIEEKLMKTRKRTKCAYKEYFIYNLYQMNEEEQDQVFLICDSRKIASKYDVNREFVAMLSDKEATNNYFYNYVRRPWCVNTKISLNEFEKKFKRSKRIIYKPLSGNRGKGVEAFDINSDNINEVYRTISTYSKGVVEEYIVQHKALTSLSPSSVNTLRIVTISSNSQPVVDGKHMDIAYAALRIGGGTSIVDNFHSGGMVAAVDIKTGKLVTDATDMEGNVFTKHPLTNTVIKGFHIPFFEESLDMVQEAIEKKKVEGYLGWDIAITENGPVLVELNTRPGVVLLSTPYAPEKKGMKHVMEKYL